MFLSKISSRPSTNASPTTNTTTAPTSASATVTFSASRSRRISGGGGSSGGSSTPSPGRRSFNRKSLLLPDILRETEMSNSLRGLCTPPPSPLYQFSFFNRSSSDPQSASPSANTTQTAFAVCNDTQRRSNPPIPPTPPMTPVTTSSFTLLTNTRTRSASPASTSPSTTNSTTANSISSYLPLEMDIIRDVGHSLRRISDAFDRHHNHKALFTLIVILKFTMYFGLDCADFGVSL